MFDIEIDSISYVEGVQTPVTGYTSKSVVMMDLEAPTFDEIEDQIDKAAQAADRTPEAIEEREREIRERERESIERERERERTRERE